MNNNETAEQMAEQMAEAIRAFGVSVQQVAETLQQAFGPFAKELIEWSEQLWRNLEPYHRSLMYKWLLKRHAPHVVADLLATRLPRNWLLPMDRLYRELVGPEVRCPQCDVILVSGETHICEADIVW